MPQIQGGRWDSYLRRLFDIKDPVIAPAVMPEIAPHVSVDNVPFADRYLAGIYMRGAKCTVPVVAGQFAYGQLVQSPSSTSLVVVTDIWIRPAGGANYTFDLRMSGATVGTKVSGIYARDPRVYPGAGGMVQDAGAVTVRRGGAPAIQGSSLWVGRILDGQMLHLPFEMALWPDDLTNFTVWCETVATGFSLCFHYYERPIVSSEVAQIRF